MEMMRKIMIFAMITLTILMISGCSEVQEEPSTADEVQTEMPAEEPEEVVLDQTEEVKEDLMNDATVVAKLMDAGCYFNISNEEVCLKYDEPKWTMMSEYCGGVCEIDTETGEVSISEFSACFGASLECETDEDCDSMTVRCATDVVCEKNLCTPIFS